MKNIFLTIISIFTIFVCTNANPQGGFGNNTRMEDIESKRVETYKKVLNLSAEEAKKFWPVFDNMTDDLETLNREERKIRRSMVENRMTSSDAEVEKAMNDFIAVEQKKLDLKKKYIQEFKKVIPIKKVALMEKAEREFKKDLIREFRKGGKPGQGGGDE